MLTVTLVASLTATAIWQQYRSTQVDAAERVRVQSGWLLTAALDWARLILREDARSGGADHLAEPWAVTLNESRLSSFLSADKLANESQRDAVLSGQIVDLQSKLNVANLIDGKVLSKPDLDSFLRLFDLLGLSAPELTSMANQMLKASTAESGAVLMPQQFEQLGWLGISPHALKTLAPYITLLPQRTPVNINTASAEVIYASTPDITLGNASKLVSLRGASHFRSLPDVGERSSEFKGLFSQGRHAVATRFFEVQGRLRLDQITQEERSVVLREGLNIRILWRNRGVLVASGLAAMSPSVTVP